MKNNILVNPYSPFTMRGIGNIIEGLSPSIYERLLNLYTDAKDIRYRDTMRRKVLSIKTIGEIDIETINRCNGLCSFCPVNKELDKRDFKLMDCELFYSIIKQLKDMDYNKIICLFGNNEPLLDERIVYFIKYVKNQIPLSKIIISTNGTLLNVDKFYSIIDDLSLLIIDNYDDNLRLHSNVKEIYDFCLDDDKYNGKVQIVLRKRNEILTTRGGRAKNRSKTKPLKSTCIYPFHQIYVRSDGTVGLCCNDTSNEVILGDLNKESIIDVWNGNKYSQLRKEILNGRKNLDKCKDCDTLVVV